MPSEIEVFHDYISTKAKLGKPATEQEIAEFETRYGVRLPSDVREYFLKINGVYESFGYITLEALDKWNLLVEYEYYAAYFDAEHMSETLDEVDKYFRFGSYDILVWHWAIKLDSKPAVETPVVVAFGGATKVAENFTDFLQKYRTNGAESLLGDD